MSSVRSVLIHCIPGKLCFKVGMMVMEAVEKEIEMTSNLQKIITIMLLVCAFPVWAGHNNDRYSGSPDGYDFARVVDAQPVFETIRVPERHRVCRDQLVQRRVAEYRSPGPAIFGAIIGGVIGNQLSHGHRNKHGHRHHDNRAAATIAGATIGGVIGREIQYSKYPARYYSETAQVCNLETSWRRQEQIVAWDVSWKYKGRIYHSRMAERPGKRIRIRVDLVPIGR